MVTEMAGRAQKARVAAAATMAAPMVRAEAASASALVVRAEEAGQTSL